VPGLERAERAAHKVRRRERDDSSEFAGRNENHICASLAEGAQSRHG
jgi:hypothetical protein